MFLPLELFIGLRYTRAKRRNHFISFISMISMLGIVVGVWALITVLSIMNGFEKELRGRILGVASHVTIEGENGWLHDWQAIAQSAQQYDGVIGQAPFILGQGLLMKGQQVNGALIRGVLPEQEGAVSIVGEKMQRGRLNNLRAGKFGIVIGSTLARMMGVAPGDKLTVIAPKGQVTPAGLVPRLRRFTVVGIFEIDMHEYDSGMVLIHMDDAGKLFRSQNQVSGIRLKLQEVYQAPQVRRTIAADLGLGYRVSDWTWQHRNFFRALKIEKRVMFIILSLIVAVAAFNIVSTLVMTVTDKQADIAILRTLGIRPISVMGIFIVQGTVIGMVGTLLGGLIGIITATNVEILVPAIENLLGIEFFPSDVYVISEFPAEMHWSDVYTVILGSFVMCLLATLYPAWRASRTQPAEALRYE